MKIFYDEKGPTKTPRIKSLYPTKFNFQSSDELFDYVSFFVGFENNKEGEIETAFKDWENRSKPSQTSANNSEFKSGSITPKLSKIKEKGIGAFNSKQVKAYSELIDMLIKFDTKYQLSILDKVSPLFLGALKPWLNWIDEKYKFNKFIRPLFIYSIVKYLSVESVYNSKFLEQIKFLQENSATMPINELLEILKYGLIYFINEHKEIPRFKLQNSAYNDIVCLIDLYHPADTLLSGNDFKISDYNMYFGLTLMIDELLSTASFSKIYNYKELEFYFDEKSLDNEFRKRSNSFKAVHSGLKSNEFFGLRIADFISGLFGKLLSAINYAEQYDQTEPGKRKLLPTEWFNLYEFQFEFIKKIYDFFYVKDRNYVIYHNDYCDSFLSLDSYINLITKFESYTTFKNYKNNLSEEHFIIYSNLTNDYFHKLEQKDRDIKESGLTYQSLEDAGILKPL